MRGERYSDRLLILAQVISSLAENSLDTIAKLGKHAITVLEYIHVLPHAGGEQGDYLNKCFARFNDQSFKPASLPALDVPIDGIIISENAPETK
jgi:hypothetical protein